MALESATWATQLDTNFPLSSDPRSNGDDHLRLIKTVLKNELTPANREWAYTGHAVKRQSTIAFTVASDETNIYGVGRRVKVSGSTTGTIYGYVASATYSATTAVNLTLTSGTLANEALQVYVGSASNQGYADVSSLTDLKALNTANYTRAYMAGYSSRGDGGGGQFYYDAASSATADNGAVVLPDSGTGRWLLIHNNTISLWQYGAFAGQGSGVDITTALDAALAACNTLSIDNLYIPAGSYYFNTEPAVIDFQVNIIGAGMFGTQLFKNFQSSNVYNGIITITDNGDGTTVRDLSCIADAGSNSGVNGTGCNLGVYSLVAAGSISFVQITRCRFTTTGFTASNDRVKYQVYMDGTNATDASIGLRACTITDCQIFGGELGSLWAKGTVSCTFRLTAANNAGGTTGLVHLGGDATVRSLYTIFEAGVASNGVTIDFCDRVLLNIPNCETIITTSDSQHVLLNTAETPLTVTIADPANFRMNQATAKGATEYTIATGAIAITEYEKQASILVDTEADAASDNLDTITGGFLEQELTIRTADAGRDVTLTESGNIRVGGATRVLGNNADTIKLIWNGTNWLEIAYAQGGST